MLKVTSGEFNPESYVLAANHVFFLLNVALISNFHYSIIGIAFGRCSWTILRRSFEYCSPRTSSVRTTAKKFDSKGHYGGRLLLEISHTETEHHPLLSHSILVGKFVWLRVASLNIVGVSVSSIVYAARTLLLDALLCFFFHHSVLHLSTKIYTAATS